MMIFRTGVIAVAMVVLSFIPASVTRPDTYYKSGRVVTFMATTPAGGSMRWTIEVIKSEVQAKTTKLTAVSRMYGLARIFSTDTFYYYSNKAFWAEDVKNSFSIREEIAEGDLVAKQSDRLVFPYNMKVGDTLKPASGRQAWASDTATSEKRLVYFNRKVVSSDTIQTLSGKIAAFRITCKCDVYTRYQLKSGMMPEEKHMLDTASVWFSPEYGVIKCGGSRTVNLPKSVFLSVQ